MVLQGQKSLFAIILIMRLIYKIDLALCLNHFRGCPDSSVGKESAYNAETLVQSLGQEDPMEGNSNLLELKRPAEGARGEPHRSGPLTASIFFPPAKRMRSLPV